MAEELPSLNEVLFVVKGINVKGFTLCIVIDREGEEWGDRPSYLVAWYSPLESEAIVFLGTNSLTEKTGEGSPHDTKDERIAYEMCRNRTVGRWKDTSVPVFTSMEKAKKVLRTTRLAILRAQRMRAC